MTADHATIRRRLAEIHDRTRAPMRLSDMQAACGLTRCPGCHTATHLDGATGLCARCLAQLPAYGGSRAAAPLFRAHDASQTA